MAQSALDLSTWAEKGLEDTGAFRFMVVIANSALLQRFSIDGMLA